MVENAVGNREIKDKIVHYFHIFNNSELGIGFEHVFGEDNPVDVWETVFDNYRKEKGYSLSSLEKVVNKAIDMGQEKRFEFIDALSVRGGIKLMKDPVRNKRQIEYLWLKIGINSMSETNLLNMQKALINLQESVKMG